MKILGPRVAIKIIENIEEKQDGLFIPETAYNEVFKVDIAEVVAVGDGYYQNAQLIPCSVKVGDKIVIPKASPRVEFPSNVMEDIVVVGDQEIVAII